MYITIIELRTAEPKYYCFSIYCRKGLWGYSMFPVFLRLRYQCCNRSYVYPTYCSLRVWIPYHSRRYSYRPFGRLMMIKQSEPIRWQHGEHNSIVIHWGQDQMADISDMFEPIVIIENVCMLKKTSLKFVSNGPINNKPELVQIMVWRRTWTGQYLNQWWISLLMHTRRALLAGYPRHVFLLLNLLLPNNITYG